MSYLTAPDPELSLGHAIARDISVDDYCCPVCDRLLVPPDGDEPDWDEPAPCGLWCEFIDGLDGEAKVMARRHLNHQRIGWAARGEAARAAYTVCAEIDEWFAARDMVTPEW